MEPLLGGQVFAHEIDGWRVSWESRGHYRHWCVQEQLGLSDRLLVVMKNPGSLSGDGANLRRDTTLRILRIVGDEVGLSQLIINLFDYAAPKLHDLHDNWQKRDGIGLVYRRLDLSQCRGILFAYGDFDADHYSDYAERVSLVRRTFGSLPEIRIPTTRAGNPVHPMNWQRNRLMSQIVAAIEGHVKRG